MTTNAQAALTAAAFSASRGGTPQSVLDRADKFLGWLNKNSPTGIKLPGASEGLSISEPLSLDEEEGQIAKALEYAQTLHPVRNDAAWKTYLDRTLRHRLNPSSSQEELRLILAEAANGFIAGRKAEFLSLSAPKSEERVDNMPRVTVGERVITAPTPDELLAQKEAELNFRATAIVATLQATGAIKGEPQAVDWANAYGVAKKQSDELAGDEWPPPVAPDEDALPKPRRKAKK